MTKSTAPEWRECAVCGTGFRPATAAIVCCSDECRKERAREQARRKSRAWRSRNPEKVRRGAAAYRAANLEQCRQASRDNYHANREKYLAAQAEWRRENPEAARERLRRSRSRNPETARRYRQRNSESIAERQAQWRAENKELWNSYSRIRRAKLGAPIPQHLLEARVAYWGNRCWICGGKYEALDHVKPVREGGLHIPANLRPICKSCNSRKSARWPIGDWLNDIRE